MNCKNDVQFAMAAGPRVSAESCFWQAGHPKQYEWAADVPVPCLLLGCDYRCRPNVAISRLSAGWDKCI